ncbi:hypothetical protein [Muriventricola aceti]|uniref:hypothetical protein n=1 Tax=Muriventricola aceti TaxID=2981773 RepID=UPI000820FEC0|nr:hypothetical protein [Muriventricola aceti]MCU6701653.1 hypothetical protein [Muriventricola aceti]SCI71185.1 Uncharacterised protein [uncultured Flavonifractor sp.]
MEYNYEKVAQSLRLMYVGNMIIIASILCTILAWIIPPLIFLVSMAVLGGTVISLVGLVKLRSEHQAYRNAVITLVIVFVVGLFANDETIFGALMSMAQDICNLLMTYFVIKGTNAVLQSKGAAGQMELGKKAWRWQLISFGAAFLSGGITLLCLLLSGSLLDSPSLILPLISVFASLAISLVALVYYLRYLKQSSEFLI